MTAKRPVTLLEYLYREMGYRKGTRVAAFIVAWGIYADTLDESVSVPGERRRREGKRSHMDGYISYWKMSRATAYRELAMFREAFPGDEYPDRVWALVTDAVGSRRSLSVAMAEASVVKGVWA